MSIFRDVFNEWFVADTSKKIRAVMKTKALNGRHPSTQAPYGYMPSAEDKFVWAVDEPAAAVVRDIFAMFIGGTGAQSIAKALRERGVKIPSYHKAERDGKPPRHRTKYSDTHWINAAVYAILDNYEYTGAAVMQKVTKKSYKDHKQIIRPEDEWIVHENAHEAIIDKDTFETVRRLRQGRHRPAKTGDLGVLNGLMVCEDCGGKLHLKRQVKTGRDGARLEYCYYECRNARQFSEIATCDCHAVKREPLEQLVLEDIRRIVSSAQKSESRFVERITASAGKERQQTVRKAETELVKTKTRIAELDRIISRIYEDHVAGKLSDDRFAKMLQGYEAEQSELSAKAAEIQKLADAACEQTANADKFLKLVRSYTNPTELTAELVREFVEKIIVGRAEHVGPGHRQKRQRIKIIYNYIGEQADTIMETSRNN